VDERLRMFYSQKFDTEYQYIYDQQQSETVDQTLHTASAEFHHRLYDSLVTHGKMRFLQLEAGEQGSTTRDYAAFIDEQYTKRVPYGRLEASLNLGGSYRENDDGSSAVAFVDQPFVFTNFQPIFIPGQTVDPNSIVITDPSGRIYTPGIDYLVTPRPDGVRIDRVIGGAIPDNSAVLVDYVADPIPGTQTTTASFGATLRYNITEGPFRGLSPYVRYVSVQQDVSGGGGLIVPESAYDYLIGADYRIWDATFTAEYEIYDSTLVPFNALRFIARLDHRVSYASLIGATASYVKTDYVDLNQQDTVLNASVRGSHLITRELVFSGSVNYVQVDDTVSGHTTGVEEMVELRWRRRQLEVYGRARNSNLNSDDSDSSFQFFEVGLRREF
jgi:hypothetical protein